MVPSSLWIEDCIIPAVKLIHLKRFDDSRGFFSEIYHQDAFREAGIDCAFVQDNYSRSRVPGVVRGLHFQIAPMAQAKLVMVTRGAIFDVAVDLRAEAPSYGQHVAHVLSVEGWDQLFIPEGFAHGFCTLEAETDVIYKVSAPYSPAHERGLLWSDPALRIEWPVPPEKALLSQRDTKHPTLAALPRFFGF